MSRFAIANALPDTAVVAVCDTSRYIVSLLKKYAGVQTFTGYQEMIDEARPDAVIVATPTSTHFRMRAIRFGAERPSFRRETAHTLAGREPCPVRSRHPAATRQPGRLPQPLHRDLPGGAPPGARRRAGEGVECSRERLWSGSGQRAEPDLARQQVGGRGLPPRLCQPRHRPAELHRRPSRPGSGRKVCRPSSPRKWKMPSLRSSPTRTTQAECWTPTGATIPTGR